jgi:TRAP-type C4-dicarboxylate transport system permease small subunit
MLGGALAFRRREHLGIDFLVGLMHADVGRGMLLLKHGIVCFAASAVFLYGGFRIVFDALAAEQTTPALGWKMGYVYSAVPLAGVFILLFALEEMFFPVPPRSITADDEPAEASEGTSW